MIVRTTPDHLLLITQDDHARLAAAVMAVWHRDQIAAPRRDLVLLATREHDNGWREEDAAPVIAPEGGRVLDFVSVPDEFRYRIWPRAVGRLAPTPYAAALVAQHALSIHERYRNVAGWAPFFAQMETAREKSLGQAGLSRDQLEADHFFVLIGDMLSLTFCNGWHDVQQLGDYRFQLEGPRLTIRPDPFDRREVLLSIAARQLPNQAYGSPAEARAAFESAPIVTVTGVAMGPP